MTDLQMMKELVGDSCRCGGAKRPHQSFCGSCYFKLSHEMRRALHQRFGKGYEEAYAKALEYLGLAEPVAEGASQ